MRSSNLWGHMRPNHLKRREFITLLGGAAVAWPLVARGQSSPVRRVGVLIGVANDAQGQERLTPFRQELRKLGWTVGGNIQIDERWGDGEMDRIRAHAAELLSLKPDAIMAGGIRALKAMHEETRTIPIVAIGIPNGPNGFVENMARPGGNVTGFTVSELSLSSKWVDLLKQIVPRVTRVAFLLHPDNDATARYLSSFETAATALAVQPIRTLVRNAAEIERAIDTFAREPNGALLLPPDVFFTVHRNQIVTLAAHHKLPAVYPNRFYVAGGGLISYGTDLPDLYRRAAVYVDRILKGERRPADLPVQAPVKFELVINLKTATTLGLDIPPTLLAIADEVIE
jgi:putative tryptophan/tyrosine transport system substrate-binding protein